MTVIRTDEWAEGTLDPVPTAAKRIAAGIPAEQPVDLEAVRRRVHPDRAHVPRLKVGVFRVPVPCPKRSFELERRARVHQFVDEMAKRGWEMTWSPRIEWGGLPILVTPGVYPAMNISDKGLNQPIWDQREFRVHAYFRKLSPEPITHEFLVESD